MAIPVFWRLYGRMQERTFDTARSRDVLEGDTKREQEPFDMKDGLFCAAVGIGGCGAVNTLIRVSPLPKYFTGFSGVAGKLYGASFLFQAGAMGIVIPVAEELVFRGLVFGGLRRECSFSTAAWLSAAAFGIYHGNVLQGIYGCVMGLLMAWGMERRGTLKAPVLMHMAANLTSVILMQAV